MTSEPWYSWRKKPGLEFIKKWSLPKDDIEERWATFASDPAVCPNAVWRDNDVFVSTFMRSGTHFVWHVVRMIVQRSADPIQDMMLDSHTCFKLFKKDNDQKDLPVRVLSGHELPIVLSPEVILNGSDTKVKGAVVSDKAERLRLFQQLPLIILGSRSDHANEKYWSYFNKCESFVRDKRLHTSLRRNRKFICIRRNPKDVLTSLAFFIKRMSGIYKSMMSMDDYVADWCNNGAQACAVSWYHHTRAWEHFIQEHPDAPILPMMYEDFVKHPEKCIKQVAKFLGIDLAANVVKEIAEATRFNRLATTPSPAITDAYVVGAETPIYYRKGIIGDWKNVLTVSQNEMVDAATEHLMEGSNIRLIYE